MHELSKRRTVFRSRLIRRADKQPQERLRRRVLGLVFGDLFRSSGTYIMVGSGMQLRGRWRSPLCGRQRGGGTALGIVFCVFV